jgi:hypothetical protein
LLTKPETGIGLGAELDNDEKVAFDRRDFTTSTSVRSGWADPQRRFRDRGFHVVGPTPGGTPGNAGVETVEFVDGSYRAVIKTIVVDGPGVSGGELLTSSNPATWGKGQFLQFDLSYEYTIDAIGGNVSIAATASPGGLQILNVTQEDASPLSRSLPTTTFTIPWDGDDSFDLFPTVFTQNSGSVSLTVLLDNVRIVPEPSGLMLITTVLCLTPFLARRRRR